MAEPMTIRLSEEHRAKIDAEGEARKLTGSQIVREALDEYFSREQSRKNFKQLLFETYKSRALLLACFDLIGTQLGKELDADTEARLVAAAGEDAQAHLQAQHFP